MNSDSSWWTKNRVFQFEESFLTDINDRVTILNKNIFKIPSNYILYKAIICNDKDPHCWLIKKNNIIIIVFIIITTIINIIIIISLFRVNSKRYTQVWLEYGKKYTAIANVAGLINVI